jgi:hypothetical protein
MKRTASQFVFEVIMALYPWVALLGLMDPLGQSRMGNLGFDSS